jgi:hypothetical protein
MALMKAADSSQVKGNISDSLGVYRFEKIPAGRYFIQFSSLGYKPAGSPVFEVDSLSALTLPTQILKAEGLTLKEVSIAVYKPAIEFKKGMVIMNVENDVLAKGNTVLELLKRIPGVIVDAQNNITINGVGGARFLIDDRLQQMPAPQVIDMLSGMSADAVSRIELIKNPPARYDAAGTGGLINIVTKKAKVKGYNGTLSLGASHGERGRMGPFVSFNYKSNKLSLFSNLSAGYWDGLNTTIAERTLIRDGNRQTVHSFAKTESFQRVLWGSGGIEYDISPKTLLGFYVNGNYNKDLYRTKTTADVANSPSFNYDKLVYNSDQKFNNSSPSYNLSLLQKIDSTGGSMKLSADYNHYLEKQEKTNGNHFYAANVETAPASNYITHIDRDFNVFTQKLDVNKTFKNKLTIESGLKSGFVNNYNSMELDFSNQSTGLFIGDTTFRNVYRYKERILAAYTTLSKSWEKIGFSIGLRAEDTDIRANDPINNYTLKRHYFGLFPSGTLDLTLNKKNTLTAAYSYRIDRPNYGMLNPIRILNEQLSYSVGNPELNPQYSHDFNLDHNYNQFITQSIGVNKTKDFMYFYSYTPDSSQVSIDTLFNFPNRTNLYYSLSVQKRIKWYSFQTYATVMYRTLNGELRGENVSSKTINFYMNLNQEFYLPKDFKIQIWAGVGSGFKDGPQYYYPRSAIHVSVVKTLLDKKLSISLSVHDLLYKDYMTYTTTFSDQVLYYRDIYDTRRVRININYRFGKMRFEQRLNSEGDSRLKTGK